MDLCCPKSERAPARLGRGARGRRLKLATASAATEVDTPPYAAALAAGGAAFDKKVTMNVPDPDPLAADRRLCPSPSPEGAAVAGAAAAPRFADSPEVRHWARSDPRGLWRWVLGRTRGNAAGIRWWWLWIRWSAPMTPHQRLTFIADRLLSPVVTLRNAVRWSRTTGRAVRAAEGVSLTAQFLDLVRLGIGAGLRPEAYYRFQAWRADRRAEAGEFIDDASRYLTVLASRLPPAADAMVRGKRAFQDWCRGQGFPAPEVLIKARGGSVTPLVDRPPEGDLFSKPDDWREGRGVRIWRHHKGPDGSSGWQSDGGPVLDWAGLGEALAAQARAIERPILLQPLLVNHPAIAGLGNGALCTLRVMTVREARAAPAQVLLAVLRIAVGDAPADSFDLGGLASAVDLRTGRCGPAVRKRAEHPLPWVQRSPETGAVIEGLELPHWREALDLARRAHDRLDVDMPVLGWDVAILPDGPVLIEVNFYPCGDLAQLPTGKPLGAGPWAQLVVDGLKNAFRVG